MALPTLKQYTEWGISLSFKTIVNRLGRHSKSLWFDIFLKVGIIFVVFVLVITVANSTFLSSFFAFRQKILLKEQVLSLEALNIDDSTAVSESLANISDKYNFDVEIYNRFGGILYTTHGSQMMDFFMIEDGKFSMSHEELLVTKSEELENGVVFEEATRRFDGSEFLLCRKEISTGIYAEVRIKRALITSSASIATEFVAIVAAVCFLLSIIWTFIFARKFSKPLILMNEISRDMVNLNFDRKLEISRNDEIGQLAASINDMSKSLSVALGELKEKNARLRDEIELERELDVMRKAFVANVSHELKTPISIISGYAEGLKLNVNSESRGEYCDIIIDESRRMNELVLSILELSRYESGQAPLKKEVFDIGEMTCGMLKRIFLMRDVQIVNEIPDNTIIFADMLQIGQVMKAYLENASAHTDDKGRITVCAEKHGNKIRISVINTGESIEEEIMPRIWQSFFRGDISHRRDQSRFGLGLSIVNAVMKLHECDCGVYNTDDGVCFWFEAIDGKTCDL